MVVVLLVSVLVVTEVVVAVAVVQVVVMRDVVDKGSTGRGGEDWGSRDPLKRSTDLCISVEEKCTVVRLQIDILTTFKFINTF